MDKERNLRVMLFTVTPFVVPLAEEWLQQRGHRLLGVLTTPGPRVRRTDDYLEVAQHAHPGLDIIVSNQPARWEGIVRTYRPDLIICASFNWKIPGNVLDIPRLGAINIHDALLPRYRGRNAFGWALRNDEPAFGVTIHYMTPEFDAGPILAQRRIAITDADDVDTLQPRFLEEAGSALDEAMDRVELHDPGNPQDESLVTLAGGAFEPEWRDIDWSSPARHIFIQARSWFGGRDIPLGAFAEIDGQRVLITKCRPAAGQPETSLPGTVLERRADGSLLVQCGDGALEVMQWAEIVEEQAAPAAATV